MHATLCLARRELSAYFFSPIAYVVAAAFLLACAGVFFFGLGWMNIDATFQPGAEATLRPMFQAMAWLLVLALPLLTMRLFSEEYHAGTIELLATAPVSDAEVVAGKFLAAMGVYAAMLAGTLPLLGLLVVLGEVDAPASASAYLGMALAGAFYVSVGLLTSSLTRHQLVAALMGTMLLAGPTLAAQAAVRFAPPPLNELALRLSVPAHVNDFARGVIDLRGVTFFVSLTALMLVVTTKTLERRRWR